MRRLSDTGILTSSKETHGQCPRQRSYPAGSRSRFPRRFGRATNGRRAKPSPSFPREAGFCSCLFQPQGICRAASRAWIPGTIATGRTTTDVTDRFAGHAREQAVLIADTARLSYRSSSQFSVASGPATRENALSRVTSTTPAATACAAIIMSSGARENPLASQAARRSA
jgi:hypothetical protein